MKSILAQVCHDRAIGGDEELEKEGTHVSKLIQLSQNNLILQAVPPLGTWARGPLCLEIHALKNPTNY